jgi:serine/threonine protein kinase
MTEFVGKDIGRYHIVEQLGQGGMATVFRAYDTRLEREVAIKFIRREEVGAAYLDLLLKRFEREAKSLAQLSHPNIVKVYDYGDYEGVPYLVMEYLPGGTLKQRLGKRVPPAEAARLLAPVARALAYAHGEHLIHRDVKPANILITRSGEPMLTDFGIAKILESTRGSTALTSTGVGMGTPDYMAPEQWTNDVTPLTDVYALGVVFFEMVTGRRPFSADTPAAVLIKQMQDPLPRPKALVPDLPDAVEQILFKALAKSPAERFQSMAAFAAALEEAARPRAADSQPAAAAEPRAATPIAAAPSAPAAPARSTGTQRKPETARKLPSSPPPTELMQPVTPGLVTPPPAAGRSPWVWLFGGAFGLALLAIVGVVGLGVVFALIRGGGAVANATASSTPTRIRTPMVLAEAISATPPLLAAVPPVATAAPGDLTAPLGITPAPADTLVAAVAAATQTPAPGGPATAAPEATLPPAPPPPAVSFRFCPQPCSQAGAQPAVSFPATTQVYYAIDFSGMTLGDIWDRIWTSAPGAWATYQGCHWKRATGTVEGKLYDNGGLRAGRWTVTVKTQSGDFSGSFTVGGDSTYWSPVGTTACTD